MAKAARSGGVVTTSDLRTCGFSEPAIRVAVRRGVLTRWSRGVYLVGPLTDDVTEARAAIEAVPYGTLGFEVAAQLAEFAPVARPPVDVIVPPDRHGERSGVRIHRIELGTNAQQLEQALDRHRGGRGTARLKRMLELGVDDLRSRAERALRHWVRQAGLPLPDFNAEVGPWRVDALWPQQHLAVEINGHAAHSSPWAHDRDHRKEQHLISAGYATRRFTALQAIDEPALVIAGIAVALAQKR